MAEETMNFESDVAAYHNWAKSKIEDIGHDTDALIKMLGDEKMGESYDSGVLTGMLANKGVDPSLLALLDGNKGMFGNDGGLLFLLFLVILMGGGNFGGWGGNGGISGVDRTVINEGNFNQLMTAITQSGQSQQMAVQTLANSLNVDTAQITGALASVDKALAVNNGDIKSAIQQCCCNTRLEIEQTSNATNLAMQQGFNSINTQLLTGFNGLQNQASQIAYAQQDNANRNTQSIINALTQQSAMIQDNFCEIRNREDAKTIQDLRDRLAEQRDSANTQLILTALANKDTIGWSGTIDGTNVSGTGSLS